MLLSNFIGNMAQGMTMITIPMYFTSQQLGNAFVVFYWCVTLVTLFWTPYAGMLVDRYDRRKIFLYANLSCTVILSAIAAAAFFMGEMPAWGAGAAFAMTFFNYNIYYACFYAFLQEITPPAGYGKLASTIEVQGQFGSTIAGALAAMLWTGECIGSFCLPKFSLTEIIAINAACYLLTYLIIRSMRYVSNSERLAAEADDSAFRRLLTGWQWLREHNYILIFGIISFAVFLVVILGTFSLNPIYAEQHLGGGKAIYAWSEVTYSIGAVVSGAAVAWAFAWTNALRAIIYLTIATIGLCVVLFLTKNEWIFYAMCFVLGLTNAGVRVLRVPYIFAVVPNWVAGRVNSLFAVSNVLLRLFFLAIFALPFFHEGANIVWSFAILALFLLFATVVLVLIYPHLPKVEEKKAP